MSGRIRTRFSSVKDIGEITEFIRTYWNANHIFVTNPELLSWQHESPSDPGNALTYLISERLDLGNKAHIVGVLGYMPFSRFDTKADLQEVSLAIWKVREDINAPGLGIQMLKTLQKQLQPTLVCAIGTSKVVRPIYQALGYEVGVLHHAALFSETRSESSASIACGVPEVARMDGAVDAQVHLQKFELKNLPSIDEIKIIDELGIINQPCKTWKYLVNRYLEHPWYEYGLRGVFVDNALVAVFVWRRVTVDQLSILRIVDFVGPSNCLAYCAGALRTELSEASCDYIDIMCWGIDAEILKRGGFVSPDEFPDLILPNYFSPFVQSNVQIEIAVKVVSGSTEAPVRLFRADSDQDRPNCPDDLRTRSNVVQ